MHRAFGGRSENRKQHRHIKTPSLPNIGKIKKTAFIARLRPISVKKRSLSRTCFPSPSSSCNEEAEKGLTTTKVVPVVSGHKKRRGIKRSLSLPVARAGLSGSSPRSLAELAMVRALERGTSFQKSRSFNVSRSHDIDVDVGVNITSLEYVNGSRTPEDKLLERYRLGWPPRSPVPDMDITGPQLPTPAPGKPTEVEQIQEKFSKLLLGEDMSGGGKGVSSALALSNSITNLAASVFGEQSKLEPMPQERKDRWRREIEWLLSVTDHIVEFVPVQQKAKNGANMEVMMTRQRFDLLMNIPALRKLDTMLIDCLDNFGGEQEYWYVSNKESGNDSQKGTAQRNDDKWWIPTPRVPEAGLSETSRTWLKKQKDSVNQVLKAAMAINAQVLTEMTIPDSYLETLPKNGRSSLGESIYKSITIDHFDPLQFLSSMDLSTDHKVLDLKNRIEASIVIWTRKLHQKDTKSSWVSLEKREQFEERAETILLLLKQRFPGLPQSSLDISKIQFNKDVGQAVLESYSRILESLASKVMSRIDDVLYAHSHSQNQSESMVGGRQDEPELQRWSSAGAPASVTLSDFMGWSSESKHLRKKNESAKKMENGSKRSYYMEKLETLGGLRSPADRH